uniref:Uncharacterized protein n=1 Tax=Arundo donax TaxID=35708 RepID=A0A0A9HDU5_ARUDO
MPSITHHISTSHLTPFPQFTQPTVTPSITHHISHSSQDHKCVLKE